MKRTLIALLVTITFFTASAQEDVLIYLSGAQKSVRVLLIDSVKNDVKYEQDGKIFFVLLGALRDIELSGEYEPKEQLVVKNTSSVGIVPATIAYKKGRYHRDGFFSSPSKYQYGKWLLGVDLLMGSGGLGGNAYPSNTSPAVFGEFIPSKRFGVGVSLNWGFGNEYPDPNEEFTTNNGEARGLNQLVYRVSISPKIYINSGATYAIYLGPIVGIGLGSYVVTNQYRHHEINWSTGFREDFVGTYFTYERTDVPFTQAGAVAGILVNLNQRINFMIQGILVSHPDREETITYTNFRSEDANDFRREDDWWGWGFGPTINANVEIGLVYRFGGVIRE
ncbi:MAG: hypothetical protein JXQ90_22575 [Cyclobacteriaceae bacterium]